jgi:peptidoglycan/LPS O-acetylase OafA/YrhL
MNVVAREKGETGFRPDIQGMRAIAVLVVMLNHGGVSGIGGGYIGVDVFFVISGFLITGWLQRRIDREGRVPFGAFYAARARRILPAAALTIIVTAVATHWLVNVVRGTQVDHDAIWSAFFAANIHFARVGTDYFAQSQPPSPLQHYWSLAVEEQFYVVWPALLAVLLFARRRSVVVAALVIAAGGSLAWSIVSTASTPTSAYFSSPARAWELAVGALLALGWRHAERVPRPARATLGWAGLAAIIAATVAYSSSTAFPGYAALLPVLGAAALIAADGAGPGRLLALRPLTYTGDISYSLYLWHWPILVIAAEHAGHQLSTWENLMLLALAYAVSALTYRLFENPLRHARVFARPWRSLTLWPVTLGTVAAVAVVGINTAPSIAASTVGAGPDSVHVATAADTVAANAVAYSVRPARLKAKINVASLTPPVTSLQHDLYDMQNCSAGFGSNTSSDICHWGDTAGTKTMIVFGDSHAQMWMLPITYFAASHGWQVIPIVKEGCVAANYIGVREPASCKGWFKWALGEVRALSPDGIVLATGWSPYVANDPRNAALSVKGAVAEAKALAPLTSKLVVVQDPPRGYADPTNCLLKRGATFGSCTGPLWAAKTGMDTQIAAGVKGVHGSVLSTIQWFCAKGKCPLVVGNTIAYVDQGHVSQSYARVLRTPFATGLGALLR